MIYLKNNTILQDVYIPRQDMLQYATGSSGTYAEGYADGYDDGTQDQKDKLTTTAFTENGEYSMEDGWSAVTVDVPTGSTVTLEGKSVTISADTTVVLPSSGFDGMSAVTVDASEYAQENYDSGFDDGFGDGYASGSTDERGKLSAVTFSANTAVTMDEGGYSAITVNVPQTGHTDQELEDAFESGYTSGHTEGMDDQKALLVSTAFTENGNYSRENGWSGISVNVDTATTYQNGYNSGVTDGENSIISTFTSTTATTNGQYGSSAHPLSAITVNVPQTGSTLKVEVNKPYTATTNGNYTILPSSGTVFVDDSFDSDVDRYYISVRTSGYPSTGYFELLTIEDEFDSSKGYIEIYLSNGSLEYDDDYWSGGSVYDYGIGYIELEIQDANIYFDWVAGKDYNNVGYDVMSAVSLNVNVPIPTFVDYLQTDGSKIVWDTEFTVNDIDDVIYFDFMPLSGTPQGDFWYTYLGSPETQNNVCLRSPGQNGRLSFRFGNNSSYFDFNAPMDIDNGTLYNVELSKTGITFTNDGQSQSCISTSITDTRLVINGWIVEAGPNRTEVARYYGLKVVNGNTTKLELKPCLDNNGAPCFYDTVSKSYIYHIGNGNTPTYGYDRERYYDSGYTDGQDSIIATFTSITATTNGQYGSSANPLSSITVNVPQTGSSSVLGVGSFSANGTYSASTDNLDGYSAITIDVPKLSTINLVDAIHTETLSANTYGDYIDTGIFPTDDIVIRVKGYRKGYQNGDRIVGWCPNETTHNDNNDFRLFWINAGDVYYDWGNSRINRNGYWNSLSNGFVDITMGNYYADDNVEGNNIFNSSSKSVSELYSGGTIRADVGSWWLQYLAIYDGNTLLFEGKAAFDSDGNIGLYDTVSEQMVLPITSKTMVYEGTPVPLPEITLTSTTITANTSVTAATGTAFSSVTVNVDTSSSYQSGFTDGVASGITVGENNIISTFSSMTATTNGIYGTSAHPLSSITVNVPQSGSPSVLGEGSFSVNGSYNASAANLDGYSAITVNVPLKCELYCLYCENTYLELFSDPEYFTAIYVKAMPTSNFILAAGGYNNNTPVGAGLIWYYEDNRYYASTPSRPGYSPTLSAKTFPEYRNFVLSSTSGCVVDGVHTGSTFTINHHSYAEFSGASYYLFGVDMRLTQGCEYRPYIDDNGRACLLDYNTQDIIHLGGNCVPVFRYTTDNGYAYFTGISSDAYINGSFYTSGYTDGFSSGYTSGYTSGYSSGYTVGLEDAGGSEIARKLIDRSITDVVTPSGCTTIGKSAFADCGSLTSVTIGPQVTLIDNNAFENCGSLPTIIIPNSVSAIGSYVFHNCTSLSAITIPNSVSAIGSNSFYGCDSLSAFTIPSAVTSIESYTFYSCDSLSAITIPSAVTTINSSAFRFCGRLSVINVYATTAPTIANYAFQNIPASGTVHYPQGSDYSSWQSNTDLSGWTFTADL